MAYQPAGRRDLITITQLKYFVSLAEFLNFSQVASQYFVAQTAISYNIKSLESELNVKLFNRTTKKTTLTDAGRIFYNRVKVAVAIIDRAQKEVTEQTIKRSLSIGSSRLTSGRTLYDTVNRFQAAHPEVDVVLAADEPELGLFDKLVHGRIDLAVYVCAPFVKQPRAPPQRNFSWICPGASSSPTGTPFPGARRGSRRICSKTSARFPTPASWRSIRP